MMILKQNNMDISLKNKWSPRAEELEKLGYNINISSGRKGATVFEKESGSEIGGVTREMVEEEEINYILYSRLNLKKKTLPSA
jgi:hypothetical protein